MKIVARPAPPQSRACCVLEFFLTEADLKKTLDGQRLDHFNGTIATLAGDALKEYAQTRLRVQRVAR